MAREHSRCLAHARDYRLDAWGDARHGDQSRCNSADTVRLAWVSVDGAGSEDAPDLTTAQAVAYVAAENARLQTEPNPWHYRYSARQNGRRIA